MNILLWILQILLALHTAMGAVWKFSNSEQAVFALQALPHVVWQALSILELLFALGLILSVSKRLSILAPIAAIGVAAEMLLYCGLSVFSGHPEYNHMLYWLVVAVISAFIAYGRLVLKPIQPSA